MKYLLTSFAIVMATAMLFAGAAVAQDNERGQRNGERRGPPPEAVEACAAATDGDPCSFEGRRGESLEGTCDGPDDRPLACRPANAPPRSLQPE
ncbi:MAG: hypothetical protein AAGA61_03440 [Pseudomonadota bacterium]